MVKISLQKIVQDVARNRGFHLAGFASVLDSESCHPADRFDFPELSYLEQWMEEGRAAEMEYLKRRDANGHLLRSSIRVSFPWVRSVVVCAVNYNSDQPYSIQTNSKASTPDSGWIARYAWSGGRPDCDVPAEAVSQKPSSSPLDQRDSQPRLENQPKSEDASKQLFATDYHSVIRGRLEGLRMDLQAQLGPFEARCFVDTGPLVERIYAKYAGLGWQGKNTCLIHESIGSWFFLGVILTSLELPREDFAQPMPDRCGSCTRCIDACPTAALEPYRMDASRCIAYLTIEKRGAIPEELAPKIGRNVFGCDICQEVCPWNTRGNRDAAVSDWPELQPRPELVNPALDWLANLQEGGFRQMFRHSPVERAKYSGFARNVAIARENSRKTKEEAACIPADGRQQI